jgi:hypothetical protein
MALANLEESVVGWVHSHPTFDAFLSSVDQHMQYSLQCLSKRSIAVVTDSKQEFKIFRLTSKGMDCVKDCPHAAGPHSHSLSFEEIFEEAKDPCGVYILSCNSSCSNSSSTSRPRQQQQQEHQQQQQRRQQRQQQQQLVVTIRAQVDTTHHTHPGRLRGEGRLRPAPEVWPTSVCCCRS